MDEALVIAGGGPAGAGAALTLARAGKSPLVIERGEAADEKLCGCFLSSETEAMLARLGVDTDQLGASTIDRVRLIAGRRTAEVQLPFRARGLSRHRLDGALIEAAARAGARIVRETIVAVAATGGGGREIETRGKGGLRASTLFLATGKHEVRGAARPVTEPCHNIGLKQMFALSSYQRERLAGAVELYLFDGGYAGLQLVENGRANFCLVISDAAWRARGGVWDDLVRSLTDEMPLLRERLEGAEPLLARPLAVARIPYGFLHTPEVPDGGVYRLGDQAAVIPSFSGDGMAIALHSGIAAAGSFLAGGAAADYHMRLRRRLARQFAVAGGLHRLASTRPGRAGLVATARHWPLPMLWAAKLTRLSG